MSGGAVGADPGAAPIDWKSESAAGRSTIPSTVTRRPGLAGPADRDRRADRGAEVRRRLLGEQDAVVRARRGSRISPGNVGGVVRREPEHLAGARRLHGAADLRTGSPVVSA